MLFNQTLTYISLFSGAGVGCYGLLEEGFECVATNEILEKRLNIQRINRKCKLDESYISGDIKKPETKEKILKQIGFYSKKFGNDRVDLVVATPPCQGMSVANHKKKNDEIKRNSFVVESVDLIKQIKPRFFILENVPSFYKTGCIDKNDNLLEIGSMIEQNLSGDYMLYDEVINFKNFGANSSRTRTLVIGVCKEFKDFISTLEFFPDFKQEKTLKEVIGSLKSLAWGEYDSADFYHSFRTYPKHMQEWIKDLKEGQSAFENTELNKKPHRMVGNKIVLNVSKNGDKYKRQKYHSVAQKLEINMIIGGPPCQGFSNKGKNLGLKDPRNFLFLEYIEIVKAIKPEIFIIENVKNIISCAKGYFLEEIKERLNALGYQLSYQILNAKDYGVPQNRESVYCGG
ncbi:DNA cytosine methyltransferase [Helicobacter pylori]